MNATQSDLRCIFQHFQKNEIPLIPKTPSLIKSIKIKKTLSTKHKFNQLQINYQFQNSKFTIKSSSDYAASLSDDEIFKRPLKAPLNQREIRDVFRYPRNIHKKYTFGKVIGTGTYGIVRKCYDKASSRKYAVKSIPKVPKKGKVPSTPRYLLKIRNEVDLMTQLGGSLNSVHLKAVFEDDLNVHLVMELCEGGLLLDRIIKEAKSERCIAHAIRSILQFIAQCHSIGIIYRDVKTDNFMYLNDKPESPLKAIDFGLSIRHQVNEPKIQSRTGTPAYMAPEVIMQSYDKRCDLWSVGMLTFQLLTGRFPYWREISKFSIKRIWKDIVTTDVNLETREWQSVLSENARDFISELLIRHPDDRSTAIEALRHPWIAEAGMSQNMLLEGSVIQRLQRFATYSELKRYVLKKISKEIIVPNDKSRSYASELRDFFDMLDTDQSKTISFDELSMGLEAQGYFVSGDEVQQLLNDIDLDRTGSIDLDEFLATFLDWQQIQEIDPDWHLYIDKIFEELDRDGDGFISSDELIDFLPPDHFNDSEDGRREKAKRIIRQTDRNKDGVISRNEFYEMMLSGNSLAQDALDQFDKRLKISQDLIN